MTQTYRQRATIAEQENAELKKRLAKQPNHQWFVDLVRRHLGQADDVHPSQLAFQVKQLKEARGGVVEERTKAAEELETLLWPSMAPANRKAIENAVSLLKGQNKKGGEE